jgi:hypothetical protein
MLAVLMAGQAAARDYYGLPPGPYRGECRNERIVNGYLLMATCPKHNGEMRDASLDLRTCPRGAPVYNDGAYLKCGSGGGYNTGGGYHSGYGGSPLPPGPYRQECRHERIEGGYLLRATCPKHDGEMRDASLDLRTCPRGAPVYNDGAYLKCGSGGTGGTGWFGPSVGGGGNHGYGLPPGPYRYQCRRERIVNGYLLMATCPKANGEMRDASLDLRTCPRGAAVYNEGAYLRCR